MEKYYHQGVVKMNELLKARIREQTLEKIPVGSKFMLNEKASQEVREDIVSLSVDDLTSMPLFRIESGRFKGQSKFIPLSMLDPFGTDPLTGERFLTNS